jgi:hypothetical protein
MELVSFYGRFSCSQLLNRVDLSAQFSDIHYYIDKVGYSGRNVVRVTFKGTSKCIKQVPSATLHHDTNPISALSDIPPRTLADTFVSCYRDTFHQVWPILHMQSFWWEYDAHGRYGGYCKYQLHLF